MNCLHSSWKSRLPTVEASMKLKTSIDSISTFGILIFYIDVLNPTMKARLIRLRASYMCEGRVYVVTVKFFYKDEFNS